MRADDGYFNKLVRIMATRAMTQAVYFASGDLAPPEYHHYGLAAPLYTHFTSPIRRCGHAGWQASRSFTSVVSVALPGWYTFSRCVEFRHLGCLGSRPGNVNSWRNLLHCLMLVCHLLRGHAVIMST